ncbi:hypothetical protein F1880_008838 [Penicillium rolfsii]|nr:hypothetical protein F1880_008838 [Penicillium rolfsii]
MVRHFTIPGAYPLNKSRMSAWWWQQGLSQPVIQLALLVSAAGHQTAMHAIHNIPTKKTEQSAKEYLRLQGNTIRILNGLLRDPTAAKSAVLIVGSLRAIEAIEGNVEAVAAHTKGLDVLIRLNGGLEMLEHMVLSKIYQYASSLISIPSPVDPMLTVSSSGDIMRAALTNTTPGLPLVASWRNEVLQEMKVFYSTSDFIAHLDDRFKESASSLQLLGTSFFAAHWYQILEDSMKKILHIFQRKIQYYEVACLQPAIVMRTDNDLFVLLEYQIISIRYAPNPSASPVGSSLLNEPLRMTLFIYLNMCVFPVMKYMVTPLQECLSSTAPIPTLTHMKYTAPDLLFWILFIGTMASRGHDGHSWFIANLVELSLYLRIHHWSAAREILGGFFYTDFDGQLGGEELWEQVIRLEQSRLLSLRDSKYGLRSSQNDVH